ncbi:MAG: DUF3016 domain-containing protein [Opitutales bacterium]|nr:DUF3016 domain-containing protein [Opitutales bacterium]
MKWKYLTAALAFVPALAAAASLEVSFVDPKSFRDFSVNGMSEERTQPVFERELARNLAPRLESLLGDRTLVIEFTDIDMAGDIQPWRNRHNQDIRYVEHIYPPRLEFNYTVKVAEGEVILEGSENLRDMSFMYRVRSPRMSDTFFYETELLRDWVRRDLMRKLEEVGE